MKQGIHPKWFKSGTVKCACGNTFTLASTSESIEVEVCSECHPFYTGTMKYLDTAGRVDAFKARQAGANEKVLSKADRRKIKREKRMTDELDRPDSLAQIRKLAKKAKKKN